MFDNFSLDCCSGPLADEPGQLIAIPVIPVPDTKSKNVLVLEECQAVLTMPVVRLVFHPVIPGNLNPVMIPGPVSVLVFAVGTVDCRSDPPLVAVLVARESWRSRVSFSDEGLDQVVLLRTSALIHIHQPPPMEFTDDRSIRLGHPLIHTTQQDALNLIPNVADMPPIRAGVGVLCKDSGREEKEKVEHDVTIGSQRFAIIGRQLRGVAGGHSAV